MTIVNFSTREYFVGQHRLRASLNGHKTLMFNSYEAIGSPSHKDSPYEFKIHAIEKALEQDDIILYCDASLWLVGDLSKLENIIKTDGYLLEEAGHYVTQWCNAYTRSYFNLQLSERHFTMFSAGFVGLNKNSELAMTFLKQWKESAKAGCFRGDWSDHRHDMTAGSIIAQRLGMKYQRGGSNLAYVGPGYSTPEAGAVFWLQGL